MSKELLPCPFCGCIPDKFGDCLDENRNQVKQILHPIDSVLSNGKRCPLNSLVFENEAWNTRASGWISVDDRLPEDGQKFLAYDGFITYAVRDGDSIEDTVMDGCGFKIEPTHWMPLPESPKEKEDDRES